MYKHNNSLWNEKTRDEQNRHGLLVQGLRAKLFRGEIENKDTTIMDTVTAHSAIVSANNHHCPSHNQESVMCCQIGGREKKKPKHYLKPLGQDCRKKMRHKHKRCTANVLVVTILKGQQRYMLHFLPNGFKCI